MSYYTDSQIPLQKGDRLEGGYIIEAYLNKGSCAYIYTARNEYLKKEHLYAIKVALMAFEVPSDTLEHEFRAVDNIRHNNVLRVYQPFGTTIRDNKFLVLPMEYADGGSLQEWFKDNANVVERKTQALKYFRQACAGVAAIHAEGLAHLDLKPDNLLLKDGIIKVADFGLARNLKTGSIANSIVMQDGVGTPYYMAPEQILSANKENDVDHRADIYALGCILFEMLKGNPPYGGTTKQIFFKINEGILPNVDNLESYLQSITLKCLCKTPKDRFQSINELIDALDVGKEVRRVVKQPATSVEPPVKPRKTTYPWRMLTGAFILLAVAASAYFRPEMISNVVSRISALASSIKPFMPPVSSQSQIEKQRAAKTEQERQAEADRVARVKADNDRRDAEKAEEDGKARESAAMAQAMKEREAVMKAEVERIAQKKAEREQLDAEEAARKKAMEERRAAEKEAKAKAKQKRLEEKQRLKREQDLQKRLAVLYAKAGIYARKARKKNSNPDCNKAYELNERVIQGNSTESLPSKEKMLQKAVSLCSKSPELHFNLGFVLMNKGENDRAMYECMIAKELRPDYKSADVAQEEILKKMKADKTETVNH
jgi:serine/threonine protein kinase